MRTLLNLERTRLTHAGGYAVLFNENILHSMPPPPKQNADYHKIWFCEAVFFFFSIVPLQEGDKSSSTYLPHKVFRL